MMFPCASLNNLFKILLKGAPHIKSRLIIPNIASGSRTKVIIPILHTEDSAQEKFFPVCAYYQNKYHYKSYDESSNEGSSL